MQEQISRDYTTWPKSNSLADAKEEPGGIPLPPIPRLTPSLLLGIKIHWLCKALSSWGCQIPHTQVPKSFIGSVLSTWVLLSLSTPSGLGFYFFGLAKPLLLYLISVGVSFCFVLSLRIYNLKEKDLFMVISRSCSSFFHILSNMFVFFVCFILFLKSRP